MEALEYKGKEGVKGRAIDALSLIQDMEELERWNGVTESKLADNWYEIKRRIAQVLAEEKGKDAN